MGGECKWREGREERGEGRDGREEERGMQPMPTSGVTSRGANPVPPVVKIISREGEREGMGRGRKRGGRGERGEKGENGGDGEGKEEERRERVDIRYLWCDIPWSKSRPSSCKYHINFIIITPCHQLTLQKKVLNNVMHIILRIVCHLTG